jgi:hypothetical protein
MTSPTPSVGRSRRRSRAFLLFALLFILSSRVEIGFCQDAYFSLDPVWVSGLPNRTAGVAVGDVNGDGYLDLVCANTGQSTTLYLNDRGTLQISPAWSSQEETTTSVALGDFDGDGDLDLVCGNAGQSTTLYLNDGGMLQTAPAWSSDPTDRTQSVALGDIDGDGDLDLVCGNAGQSTTIYLNDGGALQTLPAWPSGQVNQTYSVALGDVDNDGDLDLVCGNFGQNTTLYLNDGGVLQTLPVWSSGSADNTRSVALGDVDGDGDLDLVCGNLNQSATLYVNDGGTFQTNPAWSSGETSATRGVALGDIDGDGDLDLLCGNYSQSTTLYLNDGGILQTSPIWSSGRASPTSGVTLGDMDGNGSLDLVCGNFGQVTGLYVNVTSVLGSSPVWSSILASTNSVALGDIDNDGDLDLVMGNYNHNSLLYLNDGGALPSDFAWNTGSVDHSYSVALRDIDGNGFVDLVSGNYGQSSTVRLNSGGMLDQGPAWADDQGYNTTSMDLGDVDGDGSLDLVTAGHGEGQPWLRLYINQGAMLESTPGWTLPLVYPTSDDEVALGDLNGDGAIDLVRGRLTIPHELYLNEGNSLSTAPSWLSSQVDATVSIALGDIDGDGDLDLVCGNGGSVLTTGGARSTLYLNDGGTLQPFSEWSSGLTSKTTSVALGDLDGDGDLDLVCGNNGQKTTLYLNDEGALQLFPAWSSAPADNTKSVALGDIDRDGDLDLVCGNNGQATKLYVGKLVPAFKGNLLSPTSQLPNNGAHLRFVRAEKAGPEYYRVHFAARDVESDPIWVVPEYQYEGDPTWHPAVVGGKTGKTGPFVTSPAGVADSIEWDTHHLPFDSRDVILRLHVIEIPKRVSVIQHVAPYLHEIGPVTPYRPVISTADMLSFPAVTLGDTVSADIHVINRGTATLTITNVGLPSSDMRFEEPLPIVIAPKASADLTLSLAPSNDADVEESLVIASDDPFTPSTVVEVTADVRPLDFTLVNSYPTGEIPQETPLGISVVMQNYVHVDSARVFYREGGRAAFEALRLGRIDHPVNEQYYGSVPASSIGARGIEYFVEVYNDRFSRSSELRRLRTRVKNLDFAAVPPAKQYGMISVPLQLESPIVGVITDNLGDMDATKWRMWGYDESESVYVEVPNETITHFEGGRGYWLITRDAPPIDTAPAEGLSTPTAGPFSLVLAPGWNMVGDPFDFAVLWDSVLVNGQTMEEAESVLVEPPVGWVAGRGYEYDERVLEPFVGYWVKNRADTDVTLEIPPREVLLPALAVASNHQRSSPSEDAWQLTIRARTSETAEDASFVGVSPLARAGWDRMDRSEPPMSPGSSLGLYVVRGSEQLARDIRKVESASTAASGNVWYLDIAKTFSTSPAGDRVQIEVEGLDQIPEDAKVYLIDRTLDQMTDLRMSPVYECFVGVREPVSTEAEARFALLVGSDQFIEERQQEIPNLPTQTVLHQNHPNPFNPTTVIRYELAQPGQVTLRIYDARGALVRDLYEGHRPAGRYEVGWDGENERGEQVASGVYFYVLQTPDVRQTRKMVCLK